MSVSSVCSLAGTWSLASQMILCLNRYNLKQSCFMSRKNYGLSIVNYVSLCGTAELALLVLDVNFSIHLMNSWMSVVIVGCL